MTRAYGAECCCAISYFYLAACKCCDNAPGPAVFRVPVTDASPGTWTAPIATLDHGTTYSATVGYGFEESPVTVTIVVDNVGGFGPDNTSAKVAAKFVAAFTAATFPVAMSAGFNAYTDELTITGPTSTDRTGGFFTVSGASGFGAATVVWANPGTQVLADALAGGGVVLLEVNQDGALGAWEPDPDSGTAIQAEFSGQCFTLTETEGGELLEWRPFIGPESDEEPGRFKIANIETANVMVFGDQPEDCDDELCPENDPDHCPIICDGVCYSPSATVAATVTATLLLSDASEVEVNFTASGMAMFDGNCDPVAWCGGTACSLGTSGESIMGSGCSNAVAYRKLALPGPTTNVGIIFDEDGVPTITDNQWDATRTVSSVLSSSVTLTRTSPVTWTMVEGQCVAVDPEE